MVPSIHMQCPCKISFPLIGLAWTADFIPQVSADSLPRWLFGFSQNPGNLPMFPCQSLILKMVEISFQIFVQIGIFPYYLLYIYLSTAFPVVVLLKWWVWNCSSFSLTSFPYLFFFHSDSYCNAILRFSTAIVSPELLPPFPANWSLMSLSSSKSSFSDSLSVPPSDWLSLNLSFDIDHHDIDQFALSWYHIYLHLLGNSTKSYFFAVSHNCTFLVLIAPHFSLFLHWYGSQMVRVLKKFFTIT